MQPTSAPRCEDTASRTRRKWGDHRRGESMVAVAARRFTERPGLRRRFHARSLADKLLRQIISQLRSSMRTANPFDCATGHVVLCGRGTKGRAMFETVTAFLGLVSVGIF